MLLEGIRLVVTLCKLFENMLQDFLLVTECHQFYPGAISFILVYQDFLVGAFILSVF